MDRQTRWISIAVAALVVVACVALAVEIAGFGETHRSERRSRADAAPRDEPARELDVSGPERRVPLEPASVAPRPAPAEELVEAVEQPATEPPSEWPPPRAFTERCRARGGTCPAGCTALAGGRCLDPCFIHTAECSRDCRMPDGTCGFPPPDTE